MKVGRNDPCPCGSGRKYKKCCLVKDEAQAQEALATARINANEWSQSTPSAGGIESWAEDGEELSEATHEEPSPRPEYRYPRVDKHLPALLAEEENIVNHWWDEAISYFKKRDADQMLRRLEDFHEAHPQLFVHLNLHEEYVFELGAELARRGQWPAFISLLRRLRREQPCMYSFAFGYYDYDVAADLAVAGRVDEMGEFFSFWKQYPDSHPDKCHELISLMAWLGIERPLYELAETVAVPMLTSREVIGGNFAMDWLLIREYVTILETADDSEAGGAQLDANLARLGARLGYSLHIRPGYSRHAVEMALAPMEKLDPAQFRRVTSQFINDFGWRFAGYLRREQGVGWIPARLAGNRLEDYLYWCKEKRRSPLRFNEREIEECVVETSKRFLWIDGVRAASLLQSLAWLADYLAGVDILSEVSRLQTKETCARLFEKARRATEPDSPAFRRYGSFEQLSATDGRGEK